MNKCPKCKSRRMKASECGVMLYRCMNCGWIESGFKRKGVSLFISPWIYLTAMALIMIIGDYCILSTDCRNASWTARSEKKSMPEVAFVSASLNANDQTAMPYDGVPSNISQKSHTVQVVGNTRSKRYHLPGMPFYDKIPSERRVIFTSEEDALRAGYKRGREFGIPNKPGM